MPNTQDPTVRVNTLGYVAFDTPDLPRLTEYYQNALGFILVEATEDEAFLSIDGTHHTVALRKSDTATGRTRVGYRIDQPVEDAQRRLRAEGYEVELRSDVSPTETSVARLIEPQTGIPIHLYDSSVSLPPLAATPSVAPTKLGHIAALVPELDKMQDFYQRLLGFKWSDTIGDFFVFMRANQDHHTANFLKSATERGMHHIAYEMRNLDHLQTMLDHLAKQDIRLYWGPGRHGPGHNIFTYHRDPDGNVIELFTQIDVWNEAGGYFEPRPWHEDFPQVPKTWEVDIQLQNAWGPTFAQTRPQQ